MLEGVVVRRRDRVSRGRVEEKVRVVEERTLSVMRRGVRERKGGGLC